MHKHENHITVFEHEVLRTDKGEPGKRLTKEQYEALQHYYGNGVPYFNLCYNGVQFNEYVGVIQIGKTIIEVLPKADKADKDAGKWKTILIGMLKAVGSFDIRSTSNSSLKVKTNSILDLYFEMYLNEVEYLLHNGLAKKYRKTEGNTTALKGSLQFAKHIQQNLCHQERFYVRHTVYDTAHLLHCILYKAICLLHQINTNAALHSRIATLLLHFPEMPDIKVSLVTFEKLVLNRKTQSYKKALDIARLLLLQYHPDVSRGRNHVLALMFDMNLLWEQFVFTSLRKHKAATSSITAQTSKHFWQPETGARSSIRPDIVINKGRENCIVLDTKWKNLYGSNPSPDDLRQMYVYHEYYQAKKVALVYPGDEKLSRSGHFFEKEKPVKGTMNCSIILLPVHADIKEWQKRIQEKINDFADIAEPGTILTA